MSTLTQAPKTYYRIKSLLSVARRERALHASKLLHETVMDLLILPKEPDVLENFLRRDPTQQESNIFIKCSVEPCQKSIGPVLPIPKRRRT